VRDIQHKCKKPLTAKNPFKKGTSMSNAPTPSLTLEDIRTVSPALERYTQGALLGDVWKRPGLAPRDRSVITLAALIARNQTVEMGHHVNLALDNGVKPGEISEIITHLAFYCGWSNALSAVALAKDVFVKRGIGADQLPPASDELLPLDEAAEAQRAAAVEQLGIPLSSEPKRTLRSVRANLSALGTQVVPR
jgi:4-carboxymuconolactone decarboxylase